MKLNWWLVGSDKLVSTRLVYMCTVVHQQYVHMRTHSMISQVSKVFTQEKSGGK